MVKFQFSAMTFDLRILIRNDFFVNFPSSFSDEKFRNETCQLHRELLVLHQEIYFFVIQLSTAVQCNITIRFPIVMISFLIMRN